MSSTSIKTLPAVSAVVKFPLIDRTLTVCVNAALEKLTAAHINDVIQHVGEVQDDSVHRMLKALTDHDVVDAYDAYCAEYHRLSRMLRERRGYGFDGDEEPTIQVSTPELLEWLAVHKPAALNSSLLDYIGPDIQWTRNGRRWSWSTRKDPQYVLPKELGDRKAAAPLGSLRAACADVVTALGLRDVVTRHMAA